MLDLTPIERAILRGGAEKCDERGYFSPISIGLALKFAHPDVVSAVDHLAALELIEHVAEDAARMTERGRQEAQREPAVPPVPQPFLLFFGLTEADRRTWSSLTANLNTTRHLPTTYLSLQQVVGSVASAREHLRHADVLVLILDGDSLAFELPEQLKTLLPPLDAIGLLLAIPSTGLKIAWPLAEARVIDVRNLKEADAVLAATIDDVQHGRLRPARVLVDAMETWIATDGVIPGQLIASAPGSEIEKQPVANEDKSAQFQARSPEFANLDESRFTTNGWVAIQIARRLGAGRQERRASVRRLFAAVISIGTEGEKANTGTWLVSQLPDAGRSVVAGLADRYPLLGRYKSSQLLALNDPVANRMTGGFMAAIDAAERLARDANRAEGSGRVATRHLVGAILKQDGPGRDVQSTLARLGVKTDEIRAAMVAALPTWGVPDDIEVWLRFFSLSPQGFSEFLLPRYDSDSTSGQDRIGIIREAEAIASLVSAWSIEPPLSIGLFGDWGSGKSFFMQKIKERVRQISAKARESGMAQKDFGYYKNICQVEFNAWHYAEGNLEASLVEHIFQNLKINDQEDDSQLAARQKALLSEMTVQKTIASAADLKTVKLTRDLNDAALKVNQAKQAIEEIAREKASITARDIWGSVVGSQSLKAEIKSGLEQVGVTDPQIESIQAARSAIANATSTMRLIASGIRILRKHRRGRRLLVWVLAATAVPALILLLSHLLFSRLGTSIMKRVVDAVVALAGLAGTVLLGWNSFKPYLKPLLDAVGSLKEKRTVLEQRVKEAREEQETEVAKLDEVRKQLQQSVDAAEDERKDADRKLKEIKAELDDLNPGQLIARFIQDRSGTDEYRKHLSISARIRQDFERLASMFKRQRSVEEQGKDGLDTNGVPLANRNDPSVVNRIVLYIDDLDRCKPTQVVEVLQMIHLLLAFPLFVVIVAVDARWVRKSLLENYALMLGEDDRLRPDTQLPAQAEGRSGRIPFDGSSATPEDYLEKIFQIPFWIRPMNNDACANLVRALTSPDIVYVPPPEGTTEPVTEANSAERSSRIPSTGSPELPSAGEKKQNATGSSTPGEASDTPDAAHPPRAAPIGHEWRAVEPKPRALLLTDDERNYMVRMAPLIGRSPRAVKRFINCYRLLKSTLDSGELTRVEKGGAFKAKMVLLGLLTGFPDVAHQLLNHLRSSNDGDAPAAWARAAGNECRLNCVEKWKVFVSLIEEVQDGDVDTVVPLKDAAAFVDRFSFVCLRPTS